MYILYMSLCSMNGNGKGFNFVKTGKVCDSTYWGLVALNDVTSRKLMREQKTVTALCGTASVRQWPSAADRCVLPLSRKSVIVGLLTMFSTRRECSWRSSPWHPCFTWGSREVLHLLSVFLARFLVQFDVEGPTALSTIWVSFKIGVVKAVFT